MEFPWVRVHTLRIALAVASFILMQGAFGSSLRAEEPETMAARILETGHREFLISCAVCHGLTGDGVMAKNLFTVYPSDLRTLAKKNGGQFPFVRVINVIDGRVEVLGHGEQMMPIWGERFMTEALKDINPYNAESVARSRLLTLTYYLQSIQVQPDSKE